MKGLNPFKAGFIAIIAIYGVICAASPGTYRFLDRVDLVFHEAGHVVFLPFGATLHMLGGTIGQLFFPAACAFHFYRDDRPFEAWICGLWLAESTMYMAEYLGDARAMVLPLVGGDVHDWHWLLGRMGLVEYCKPIAWVIHALASLLAIACLGKAAALAFGWGPQAEDEGLRAD